MRIDQSQIITCKLRNRKLTKKQFLKLVFFNTPAPKFFEAILRHLNYILKKRLRLYNEFEGIGTPYLPLQNIVFRTQVSFSLFEMRVRIISFKPCTVFSRVFHTVFFSKLCFLNKDIFSRTLRINFQDQLEIYSFFVYFSTVAAASIEYY